MVSNKEKHVITVRSGTKKIIDHTLLVCRPLAEAMDVQQLQILPDFIDTPSPEGTSRVLGKMMYRTVLINSIA